MKVEVLTKSDVDEYGFVTKTKFRHHNYTEMETFLKDMNETYPNITSLYSIGKSVNGRELYVMVVSSTPLKHVAGKGLYPSLWIPEKNTLKFTYIFDFAS